MFSSRIFFLFIVLIYPLTFVAKAQKDSTAKSIRISLGKDYNLSIEPAEKGQGFFKEYGAMLGVIAGLIGVAYQINSRRKDDTD